MESKNECNTGTPSIIINNKVVKVPANVSKSMNVYLDWLYNEYKKTDPNFKLTPEEFINKLHELMSATWKNKVNNTESKV